MGEFEGRVLNKAHN